MNDTRTVFEARRINEQLKKFKTEMKAWEKNDPEYRDWCEGIIMASIAALSIISGDQKMSRKRIGQPISLTLTPEQRDWIDSKKEPGGTRTEAIRKIINEAMKRDQKKGK